jgi:hypothetical protein
VAQPADRPSRFPGVVLSFLPQLGALAAAIALWPWATDPAVVVAGGYPSLGVRFGLILSCLGVVLLCQVWRWQHLVRLLWRRRPTRSAMPAPLP